MEIREGLVVTPVSAAKFAGKLTHDSPTRAPCPIGVGVGLPACDLVLIRRPIGRYRATSKIEGIRTLDPWSEVELPSQPHQLTTERGYISGSPC